MEQRKKVLLIAGGGTLGTYAAKTLLEKGCYVDVACLEEKTSDDPRLRYFQGRITEETLPQLLEGTHYDGIINFIHYEDHQEFQRIYPVLMAHTDHMIFLSSYRVYADEQHPITEEAPRLLDVVKDPAFLETEDYAVPKSKCEDFLRGECAGQNWTIVRPVISFSALRLDLFMHSKHLVPEKALAGEPVLLPAYAKSLTAGLDWAGNSGRLIAGLLFKPETFGEAYTISSGQNLTWEQVAQLYSKLTGAQIRWVSEEKYLENHPVRNQAVFMYYYDRKFDRSVDCSKVLKATGIKKEDLTPMEEGLKIELERAGYLFSEKQ